MSFEIDSSFEEKFFNLLKWINVNLKEEGVSSFSGALKKTIFKICAKKFSKKMPLIDYF